MNKSALVFAAHPDDEVLGCGGTMAKLASEGWQVNVVICAEGATSRSDVRDKKAYSSDLSELAKSAEAANKALGTTHLYLHDFPDNRMDSLDLLDVVKFVEGQIEKHQPSLVLTHHAGDVNIDHRVLHDAVIAACRPQPNHPVRTLLFFEVASSTEWRPASSALPFTPNYFVDVSNHMEMKTKALEGYASEMRDFPYPRSIEALQHLAKWRGASVGCYAAEAFMLGLSIN